MNYLSRPVLPKGRTATYGVSHQSEAQDYGTRRLTGSSSREHCVIKSVSHLAKAVMAIYRRTAAVVAWAVLAAMGGFVASPTATKALPTASPLRAVDLVASVQLPVSGLEDHSRFGTSVAIFGSIAVVGAPLDDNAAGTDAGAAYVFTRSGTTWTQESMLIGTDTSSGDRFGTSVDVFAGGGGFVHVVVGAPFDDNPAGIDAGAAYIFRREGTTWSQARKVTIGHNRGTNDQFGSSVTIARSDALIGVPLDDTPNPGGRSGSGSVSVFYRPEDWGFRSSFNDGASAGDFRRFGTAVEMSALTAVVGAPKEGGGAVYVFERPDDPVSPWTQQARLTSEFSAEDFGTSVAVDGDDLVVGEPTTSTFFGQGIVYVFKRSGTTWQQTERVLGSGGDPLAFGQSVAISGTSAGRTIMVGAPDTNQRTGIVHVYRQSGSTLQFQHTITASDASTTDRFGHDVDLTVGTALIGAPNDNTTGTDNGSAYVVSAP